MLRFLMQWCVPTRSLQFRSELDGTSHDESGDDTDGRDNLFSALTSHGVGPLDINPTSAQSA